MRKPLIAVLAIVSVAAGTVWAASSFDVPVVVRSIRVADPHPAILPYALALEPIDAGNYRRPILNAAGTQPVGPGEERIPIPVDGVAYEVVVTRPAPLPLLVPARRQP